MYEWGGPRTPAPFDAGAVHSAAMQKTLAQLRDAAQRNDWAMVQEAYIDLQLEPGSNRLDGFAFGELTLALRLRDAERVAGAVDALLKGGGLSDSPV